MAILGAAVTRDRHPTCLVCIVTQAKEMGVGLLTPESFLVIVAPDQGGLVNPYGHDSCQEFFVASLCELLKCSTRNCNQIQSVYALKTAMAFILWLP
jgi:hypothetical protein